MVSKKHVPEAALSLFKRLGVEADTITVGDFIEKMCDADMKWAILVADPMSTIGKAVTYQTYTMSNCVDVSSLCQLWNQPEDKIQ